MEDNESRQQEKKADPQIEDLPRKVTPDEAEKVKGGQSKPGGDDDDLDELEVQR